MPASKAARANRLGKICFAIQKHAGSASRPVDTRRQGAVKHLAAAERLAVEDSTSSSPGWLKQDASSQSTGYSLCSRRSFFAAFLSQMYNVGIKIRTPRYGPGMLLIPFFFRRKIELTNSVCLQLSIFSSSAIIPPFFFQVQNIVYHCDRASTILQ